MSLRLGDVAPDFSADSTMGSIQFHEWLENSWGILFSHPKDFTPVCTTELGYLSKIKDKFEARNTKVIGLSVDDVESHKKWVNDINETQNCTVNYPIIADTNHKVAELYDMIHPKELDQLTVRSVFIIAPDKSIRLMITYPASTGRNFDEILRVLESLQLTADHKVATPVNWKHGEDCVIVPSVQDSDIPGLFPKGHRVIKPYLRMTPQPDIK